MDDNNIVLYKKAKSTNGISWDYKKKFVIHISEKDKEEETVCGLRVLEQGYGWKKLHSVVNPTCPECKRILESIKRKVASVVATS
ncbi:hypothetical protein H8D29_03735 [PVC group bacterium]|nr:hypothetical protein [PVC group bacterium]